MEAIQLSSSDDVSSDLLLFKSNDSAPVIICIPALGVKAAKYQPLAEALQSKGFNVAIMELRGNGSSSLRVSREVDFGYSDLLEKDIPAVISSIAEALPASKRLLFGHSLGGQLAALYLARSPTDADGIILSASCNIHYQGWAFPQSLAVFLFTQIGFLIACVLGYFPGRKLGFAGTEAKSLIRDWAHTARTGRYEIPDSDFDYENSLNNVTCPVLAINYEDDLYAPVSATNKLLEKLSPSNTHKLVLNGDDIGKPQADHFNWMKAPQQVAEIITQHISWLGNLNKAKSSAAPPSGNE